MFEKQHSANRCVFHSMSPLLLERSHPLKWCSFLLHLTSATHVDAHVVGSAETCSCIAHGLKSTQDASFVHFEPALAVLAAKAFENWMHGMAEVCEGAVAVSGWVLTDRHDVRPCAASGLYRATMSVSNVNVVIIGNVVEVAASCGSSTSTNMFSFGRVFKIKTSAMPCPWPLIPCVRHLIGHVWLADAPGRQHDVKSTPCRPWHWGVCNWGFGCSIFIWTRILNQNKCKTVSVAAHAVRLTPRWPRLVSRCPRQTT